MEEEFSQIRGQLRGCPSCGEGLVSMTTQSVLQCPEPKHGYFTIIWSRADRRYYVSYHTKS